MEMVGHADTGMHRYLVAVGGLYGGCLQPGLLYLFAERGWHDGFVTEIGHEMREQVGAATHYQRDEIGAAAIVVMTGIAGAVGGWHSSAYLVRL